jgi:hypothetical protein
MDPTTNTQQIGNVYGYGSSLQTGLNLSDLPDPDAALENLFSMATINVAGMDILEDQLRTVVEVQQRMLTEIKVLNELVNQGLNIHEDLKFVRPDLEDYEDTIPKEM